MNGERWRVAGRGGRELETVRRILIISGHPLVSVAVFRENQSLIDEVTALLRAGFWTPRDQKGNGGLLRS